MKQKGRACVRQGAPMQLRQLKDRRDGLGDALQPAVPIEVVKERAQVSEGREIADGSQPLKGPTEQCVRSAQSRRRWRFPP